MKIKNQTRWNTQELRKIFGACLREMTRTEKKVSVRDLRITVKYHRTVWVGGSASYASPRMTIKMPYKDPHPQDPAWFIRNVATTFIHEFGHNLGIRHRGGCKTIEHLYSEWIQKNFNPNDYPLSLNQGAPKPSIHARVHLRHQRAQANLEKAETRLKRARTLYNKWLAKLKYYEKKNASQNGSSQAAGEIIGR